MDSQSRPEQTQRGLDSLIDEEAIESKAEKVGRVIGAILVVPTMLLIFGLIVGILIAAGFVIRDAAVADAPEVANPSFIDQVIASKAVLVSVRLALIAASGYLILSLVMLTVRRQWISKIGWVELGDRQVAANEDLVRENEGLYMSLANLGDENEALKEQLQQADKMIDDLLGIDDDFGEEAEFYD